MVGFSLWLVSLFRELSLFAVYPPHSVILREAEGEVAESTSIKLPSPSKRVVTVADVGSGPGKSIFTHSSSALTNTSPQGWRLSFTFWKSRFCNSGQALRAEWHDSEVEIRRKKIQFLKVLSYKRHDSNCFCLILNRWINQKTMYPESIKILYT